MKALLGAYKYAPNNIKEDTMEDKLGKVEFYDKVFVNGRVQRPIIRVLMMFGIGGCIILFLLQIIGEGFSFGVLFKSMIPLVLFTGILSNTKSSDGYKSVATVLEYNKDGLTVIHEFIDRDDKMGKRREEVYIGFNDISKIEYSKPLKCFNIQGRPVETVKYLDKAKKRDFIKDYKNKGEEKRTFIYVSDEDKRKIERILKCHANTDVIELD